MSAEVNSDRCHSLIALEGQVVHIRNISKKMCYIDIVDASDGVRRTCVLKLWLCGQDVMTLARKSDSRIRGGDRVRFMGNFEDETSNVFAIESFLHLERHSPKDAPFVPIPPKSKSPLLKEVAAEKRGPCKYWLNSGRCQKGDECVFRHPRDQELALARRQFVEDRIIQREALQRQINHDDDSSLSSRHQRASLFAEWLQRSDMLLHDPKETIVLDVAGGRGDLSFELGVKRRLPVVAVDPRGHKVRRWQRNLLQQLPEDTPLPRRVEALFSEELLLEGELRGECVALIVGLHPDEATEPLVDVALALRIPFAVVPCCVFARAFPDRRLKNGEEPVTYEQFLQYLMEKNGDIRCDTLGFRGRDKVLYWRPR